jgi:hypothetical protein
MSEQAPELGGEKSERVMTGQEPLLSNPDWKRLGKRQRAMLRYLAGHKEGSASYVDCWMWVAELCFPGYRHDSDYRKSKIRGYVSKTAWNLLRGLEARNLVLLIRSDEHKHLVGEVRLRFEPDYVLTVVEPGVPLCRIVECGLPLTEFKVRKYEGCCDQAHMLLNRERDEVTQ